MKANLNVHKNKKLAFAAAIVAFLGAAGYMVNFINHFTNYVIKIKYSDAVVYGLLPAVLIVLFGVALLVKKLSSVLISASSGAILIYYVSLLFSNGDDAQSDSTGTGGSIFLVFLEAVSLLLLMLTVLGILKIKAPSIVFSSLNIGVACLGLVALIYVNVNDSTAFAEYYGVVFSMLGLLLYFVSTILTVLSISKKSGKNAIVA